MRRSLRRERSALKFRSAVNPKERWMDPKEGRSVELSCDLGTRHRADNGEEKTLPEHIADRGKYSHLSPRDIDIALEMDRSTSVHSLWCRNRRTDMYRWFIRSFTG